MSTNNTIYVSIGHWLRLVRVNNLIMIGLTLFLLRWKAVDSVHLDLYSFFLMVLGTLMVAAAGNIINDILDYEIDQVNKPHRLIIKKYISIPKAYTAYIGLNASSVLLAFCLGDKLILLFFISAILLLYFYSTNWKRQAIIGNVVVALLCAWVVIQFWYVENQHINAYWQVILGFYTAFAFLSTWAREIIKDMEDMDGDKLGDCQTMPIWIGEQQTLRFLRGILVILLLLLISEIYFFYSQNSIFSMVYTFIILVSPLVYIGSKLSAFSYSTLSKYAKLYMLGGLLLLLL